MTLPTARTRIRLLAALALGAAVIGFGSLARLQAEDAAPKIATITAQGLRERLIAASEQPLVVDVREPDEFEAAHIAEAKLAPLGTVVKDLEGVDRNREIVLVCRSGRRSAKAYELLAAQGFRRLENMEGGMLSWEKLGYPVVKKQ